MRLRGNAPCAAVVALLSMLLAGCTTVTQQWTAAPCATDSAAMPVAPCGRYSVSEANDVIADSTRNRSIPIKVYSPSSTVERFPTIIFSHGIGNSHEGYRYLGRYWASHGFVSIHLSHSGSDKETLLRRGRFYLARTFFRRSSFRRRVGDVRLIAAMAEQNQIAAAKAGDPTRLALAGHSLGALTVLEAADKHIDGARAVLALSPPAVGVFHRRNRQAAIGKPTLFMQGGDETTYDEAGHASLAGASDVYQLEMPDAVHETFSDDEEEPLPTRERDIALIQRATTAFWQAYLAGDVDARAWLESCDRNISSCVVPALPGDTVAALR